MSRYSAAEGMAGDRHFAHLARASQSGGWFVIVEAAAVTDVGRITCADMGILEGRTGRAVETPR